eukprot:352597-Chlamydomonas_euryale.AAC.2
MQLPTTWGGRGAMAMAMAMAGSVLRPRSRYATACHAGREARSVLRLRSHDATAHHVGREARSVLRHRSHDATAHHAGREARSMLRPRSRYATACHAGREARSVLRPRSHDATAHHAGREARSVLRPRSHDATAPHHHLSVSHASPHRPKLRTPALPQVTINGQSFVLIDTAGIRKRARVADTKDGAEPISVERAFRAMRRADVTVMVVDASEGVTQQDFKLSELAAAEGAAVVVVVNKWDVKVGKRGAWATGGVVGMSAAKGASVVVIANHEEGDERGAVKASFLPGGQAGIGRRAWAGKNGQAYKRRRVCASTSREILYRQACLHPCASPLANLG